MHKATPNQRVYDTLREAVTNFNIIKRDEFRNMIASQFDKYSKHLPPPSCIVYRSTQRHDFLQVLNCNFISYSCKSKHEDEVNSQNQNI